MEKKMETTIVYWGNMGLYTTIVHWGNMGLYGVLQEEGPTMEALDISRRRVAEHVTTMHCSSTHAGHCYE